MDNLILVGFSCSGKTTLGRNVARRLRLTFVDSDRYVEDMTGRSIPDIFREDGEVAFRAIEHEAIARIMAEKNPTFDPDIVNAQWKASIAAMQTDYVRKHGYGVATLDRLQRTIMLARTALKIETEVTPDQLFAQGFIAP